jgi:hypothetical protein
MPDAAVASPRPARALFGWMSPEAVQAMLQASVPNAPVAPAKFAEAISLRAGTNRQSDMSSAIVQRPCHPDLNSHVALLRTSGTVDNYLADGWTVAMLDLTRVAALQPHVFVDRLGAVRDIAAQGPAAVAALTLPLPAAEPVQVSCDQAAKSWTVVSANPNLHVVAAHSAAANTEPGSPPSFGFVTATLPSFVQAAHIGDRYVLRDGYHRAVGLIACGVTTVPALVRDFKSADAAAAGLPPGMLPLTVWMANNAPKLPDYLDDRVSDAVALPATRRAIVITAIELTIPAA